MHIRTVELKLRINISLLLGEVSWPIDVGHDEG